MLRYTEFPCVIWGNEMNRTIVIAALLSLIGVPALAADLPVKAPLPPPPIFSWTGCYAGVHVGAGWINNQIDGGPFVTTVPSTLLPTALLGGAVVPISGTDFGSNRSTAILGGQAGCNYQFASHLVVGVEVDANWAGFRAVGLQSASTTATLLSGAPSVPFSATASSTGTFSTITDVTATLTGRLGYAWDRLLLYGKGGGAWIRDSYSFAGLSTISSCTSVHLAPPPPFCLNPTSTSSAFNFVGSDTRFGWTVGIGVEWAFTDQWSLKGEYDFMDFGRRALALSDPILGSQLVSVRQQIDEFKLGVNYRWGGPFVASY